ncbi:MAG: rRNA pseudouridine synthase [Ruminococcaceae bacterium]|nr:rRNA pseudouridine synthase [Oscillospiraceae bacterium]
MNEQVRLAKYFTDCGVLSRRAAEEEIKKGRVKVNGTVAELGQKITPGVDVVEYGGKRIMPSRQSGKVYIMLHKPRGFVTTMSDEKGRPTVAELVRSVGTRVYPVGRLDMDSSGLLLMTNDGELANRLTHPRHDIPKIYHVTVAGHPTTAQMTGLGSPADLDGYITQPIRVRKLAQGEHETMLEMTLYEGRNRQIRRICEMQGLRVKQLVRVAVGEVLLGELPEGKYARLSASQIAYLKGERDHV